MKLNSVRTLRWWITDGLFKSSYYILKMKFFIGIISLILPVSVFCSEIKNKDSEKFQQYPVERSESFYCNDLKPQIQIDFSMVKTNVHSFLKIYK